MARQITATLIEVQHSKVNQVALSWSRGRASRLHGPFGQRILRPVMSAKVVSPNDRSQYLRAWQ